MHSILRVMLLLVLLVPSLIAAAVAREHAAAVAKEGTYAAVAGEDAVGMSSSDTADNDTLLERGKDLVDSALIPVYDMTNYFLEDIVQHNDLTYMQEKGVDFTDFDLVLDSFENDYEDWVKYFLGYSICVLIGLLLLILPPLIALITCCCRTFCGTCGGKVDPVESSTSGCKRTCCGFFLFIFITIVLLGAITMFFTAAAIHRELYSDEDIFHSMADGINTMDVYINDTLDELSEGTLGIFEETADQVFTELKGVVTSSYNQLDSAAGISANMVPILIFTAHMSNMSMTLNDVEADAVILQADADSITNALPVIQTDIVDKITCTGEVECDDLVYRVNNLSVIVDYSNVDFTGFITALDAAVAENVDTELQEGYDAFQDIITQINDTVNDEIDSADEATDDVIKTIEQQLADISDDITAVGLNDVAEDLIELSEDDMEEPAFIVFISLTGVASLLAFIVLLTYIGLLCGCCPRSRGDNDYCCTRKVGATFVVVASKFTFVFYWIFMLVLLYMFIIGGPIQTELCRHLVALDESPISDIMDDLVNASIADDTGFSINITDIYTNCKNDEAFYTALDIEDTFGFNLDTILDTSDLESIIENIKDTDITISTVDIITDPVITILDELSTAMESAKSNINDSLVELNKHPVTSEDITILVADLQTLATDKGLTIDTTALTNLHTDQVKPLETDAQETYNQLKSVSDFLDLYNISAINQNLQDGEEKVNNEGADIIGGVINDTADAVLVDINSGVDAIDNAVRYEIGKCEPVYNAISTIVDSACVELLYAFNGYWFALGWSIFFLLFTAIMSCKMATLYRKTVEHDDPRAEEMRNPRAMKEKKNRQRQTDETVLITRNTGEREMMPLTNPVFIRESDLTRIPRPQVAYPEETVFITSEGRPPSYVQHQSTPSKSKKHAY